MDNMEFKMSSPKKTFVKYFFVTFLIVAILGVSGLGAYTYLLDSQVLYKDTVYHGASEEVSIGSLIPAEGMFATDPEFTNANRVNILLLGTTREKLSDTMMLASYDQDTKEVDIISVPRDTYHEREGFSEPDTKKINAAFGGDPVSAAQAVHEVLQGIPINYYAVIDYDGVANIVDAIGGVEIDVPMDMNYEKHSEDPPLIIHLKKGRQLLDGKDAVGFIRYRKGYINGDEGRVHAQQEFVKEAIKQSLGLNLPSVGKAVIENVDSDITPRVALSLANGITNKDDTAIKSYTLPGNPVRLGLWYYFCDGMQTEEMLRSVYSGADFEATESAISGPDDPDYYVWDNGEEIGTADGGDDAEAY